MGRVRFDIGSRILEDVLHGGHAVYGLLVGAIALFAASISDIAATAAIITLEFTVGSWVLDFALAGQPGTLEWISRLSLTQTLRSFEQGLFSAALVLGVVGAISGFAVLAAVWLHPGVPLRAKLIRSLAPIAVVAALYAAATQIRLSPDFIACSPDGHRIFWSTGTPFWWFGTSRDDLGLSAGAVGGSSVSISTPSPVGLAAFSNTRAVICIGRCPAFTGSCAGGG